MQGEALRGGQFTLANLAVHQRLRGLSRLAPTGLEEERPDGEAALLRPPHRPLHLTVGRHAGARLMPAELALKNVAAVVKQAVLGEGTNLVVDMFIVLLRQPVDQDGIPAVRVTPLARQPLRSPEETVLTQFKEFAGEALQDAFGSTFWCF